MKLKLIFAATALAAMVSCQKGETKIEVNRSDIPEGFIVEMGLSDDHESNTIYRDSSNTTDRKFTIKCDTVTDNTLYYVLIQKDNYKFYSASMRIFVQDGYTATVTGSGVCPSMWTIDSKNSRQAFENKMMDPVKELYKQRDEIRLFSDTVTTEEGRQQNRDKTNALYDQIDEIQMTTLQSLPVDKYMFEELCGKTGRINVEGKDYKYFDQVDAMYNNLPDEYKNSKAGKALYYALHGTAPAVGDEVIDYDLYDIDGNVHHFADYRGKWFILEFSTYYCGPCRLFSKAIKVLYQRGVNKNLEIIDLTLDTPEQFATMAAEEQFVSPLYNDRDMKNGIFAINKIACYPTFYLVNPDGVIEDIVQGYDMGWVIASAKKAGAFAPEYKTEKGVTVVSNPDMRSDRGLWLESVELYKDSTVLNVSTVYYCINEGTTLRCNDGKTTCPLISSSIGLNKFTDIDAGMVTSRLTFKPLPKGIKEFDMIEGDCPSCFRLEGIKIAE